MRITSAILHRIFGKNILLFNRVDNIGLILYDTTDYDAKMTNSDGQRKIHYM